MNAKNAVILAIFLLTGYLEPSVATDRIFPDLKVRSPSKNFELEATSPHNLPGAKTQFGLPPRWQSKFEYTLTDLKTNKVLWTRKQDEASPVSIHLSDTGWTAIFTGWDELVIVDPSGKDRGLIEILKEGFKDEEDKSHIVHSSAGPIWTPYSLWCFVDLGKSPYFSIRTWWGRRLFIDLEEGKLAESTAELLKATLAVEKKTILARLTEAVETLKEWEDSWDKAGFAERVISYKSAVFVAGKEQIKEAIPALEKLQESQYLGIVSTGGIDGDLFFTMTMRQVAQLSLRRLGVTPKSLPANGFGDTDAPDNEKTLTKFAEIAKTRVDRIDQVTKEMKLQQVVDLLGAPDFIYWDRWEFDLDAVEPFTLILKQDGTKVIDIEKKKPPLWKENAKERDRQMIF